VGLIGWLFRRWLAGVIYGPLLVAWYVLLAVLVISDARNKGQAPVLGPGVAVVAVIAALISDYMIMKRVKRRMKRRPPPPPPRPR